MTTSDPTAGARATDWELPKIVSVDDHVVEPPHVWATWLPERFRERGPKVERRGIGHMKHIGGGQYEQTFDPDGPKADCWSSRTSSTSTSATSPPSGSTATT